MTDPTPMTPPRCADHAGLCSDLAAAEALAGDDRSDIAQLGADVRRLLERVHKIELRIAAVVGAGMILSPYLPRIVDALVPVARAACELAMR